MKSFRHVIAGACAAFLLVSGSVGAASQCKGLSQSVCASDSSCRWVDSYVRKDGREVSAHCRLGRAGKKSASTEKAAQKLSAAD